MPFSRNVHRIEAISFAFVAVLPDSADDYGVSESRQMTDPG